jgi:hypothetical protein
MPTNVRASDADRDKVAAVLREAVAEGRLDLSELDERLTVVYEAKTYAELEPATRDLPRAYGATPATGREAVRSRRVTGFMGGLSRKGHWSVPGRLTALVIWGGGGLDMRKAQFAERETKIRAIAIMGGMGITVPHNAEVHIRGRGIMGGFGHGAAGPGEPGAPKIVISGIAFWGGIGVRRRPPRALARR